jgi:ATP-binding cassette, subfamily B, bacterial MsbA
LVWNAAAESGSITRRMRRFRPYLTYLKMVRGPLIAAIVCGVVYGASSGAGMPTLVKYVFPAIFSHKGAGLSLDTVALIAASIPLVFLLRAISGYLNSYYIQLSGVRILEALRIDYFRKLQVLPLSFLQRESTGDLLSRGLADTQQLQYTLTQLANDGLKQPMQLAGTIGFLVWQAFASKGVMLVLGCMAIIPLSVLPVRYVGRKVLRRAHQLQRQLGSITSIFSENLAAAREVRAFGLEERETGRFAEGTHTVVSVQMKIVKYAQALTPAIEVLSAVGIAATLVIAYGTNVTLDSFLAVVTALYLSYEPVKKLGALNNEMQRGTAALERLEAVLNEPVPIQDPARPVTVGRLHGEIAFDRVTFAYGETPALREVSVRIPAGAVCALVGPSGAGKSTFANLVPRFFEVGTGAVTIDGIDLRAMRLADLRRNIAVVSQDPVLFNDTVYNNLLLGRPEASRDEVMAAAIDAHADEFIRTLPQSYDTMVGERGALLSGGQKQRVAVARAFLRGAPILILDEATSALDSQSEQMIQEALHHLVVGRTVIIIAHRFSTIRDATLILVFDQGRIVAQGDHAQLYASNALYKGLYDRQHAGAA